MSLITTELVCSIVLVQKDIILVSWRRYVGNMFWCGMYVLVLTPGVPVIIDDHMVRLDLVSW